MEDQGLTTQEIGMMEITPDTLHMIPYNTGLEPITLAEYGRNIQNLVDFCVSIPDREERTRAAYGIADIMCILFPSLKKDSNGIKKIWDHINIMARFNLDIDFPVEVLTEEEANPVPEIIPYSHSRDILFRYYGKHIQDMIMTVADMEDSEDKEMLINMIANHMKKLMLAHNKENVSDEKVLRDLRFMSSGKIDLDPEIYVLHEYQEVDTQPKQGKKKKKNNF